MTDPLFTRLHLAVLTMGLVTVSLFSAVPELDLAFSRLFTDGAGGFAWNQTGWVPLLNAILRRMLELVAWGSVLAVVVASVARARLTSGLRAWGFVAASFALGPGILVNVLLKESFGRARPADVIEFGGTHHFTPVLKIADQCTRNCSFSSGEVAMTSTFVFVMLALFWPQIAPRARKVAVLAGAALIMLSITLRVGLGRHFLSDALSSMVLSALVTLACYRLLRVGTARPTMTGAALMQDAGRLRQWLGVQLGSLSARLCAVARLGRVDRP